MTNMAIEAAGRDQRPGARRDDDPTIQCDRKLSSPRVSLKRISAVLAGDFQQILAKVAIFRILEARHTYAKIPINKGFGPKRANYLQLSDCLAGAGGFEPPHGGMKIRRDRE